MHQFDEWVIREGVSLEFGGYCKCCDRGVRVYSWYAISKRGMLEGTPELRLSGMRHIAWGSR